MKPKSHHLGSEYAARFADPSVVDAYRHRPPYPEEAIRLLLGLATGRDALLDVGTGRGDLAIPLAPHFARVDAIDPSPGMIRAAREGAGATAAHVGWQEATLADARLAGPYDLATAGESLHWTDWETDLPRIAGALAPGARLAIVTRCYSEPAWASELRDLVVRVSTNREYRPFDLVEELTERGLFVLEGREETPPRPLVNPLAVYVASFHSMSGLSRDRLTAAAAEEFDAAVRAMAARHGAGEEVRLCHWTRVEYGRPTAGG